MINPLVSVLRTGGVATLTVAGRATGRRRTVPVIPVAVDGQRYLVSPYGESDWVRNLRAAGKGELHGRGERETIQATEVPVQERAPIITAYCLATTLVLWPGGTPLAPRSRQLGAPDTPRRAER